IFSWLSHLCSLLSTPPSPPDAYPLSLHDALPISLYRLRHRAREVESQAHASAPPERAARGAAVFCAGTGAAGQQRVDGAVASAYRGWKYRETYCARATDGHADPAAVHRRVARRYLSDGDRAGSRGQHG